MRLPTHLHLVLPRFAWFEFRNRATQSTSESRVLLGKAKIEKNETRDVPRDKGRSEKAIKLKLRMYHGDRNLSKNNTQPYEMCIGLCLNLNTT